jgi:putative hydroxymethylpyrimidine transporter CytX
MTEGVLEPTIESPAATLGATDDRTIGIEPVPEGLRRMRAIDVAVLWGNLSIGILVLAAGAILVTDPASGGLGQSLPAAVWAVLIGSVAGGFLLAAVAWIGHDPGRPSMALLRSVLGRRGSELASVLYIVQLVGWTAFEFWAMSQFAGRITEQIAGGTNDVVWVLIVAVVCGGLALAGPLNVVRVLLERVATWVLLVACGGLTVWLLVKGVTDPGTRPGAAPFAVAIDLVVAMPVSWLSVVADYNRFSVDRRANFLGTFAGSVVGNAWLYLLGVLLVLSARLTDSSPAGIATGIIGAGVGTLAGLVVLAGLLAGETDNAFADIYSTVVSAQNLTRRVPYTLAVVVTVAISALIAVVATVANYETFLYLLGSVFVPLFAVVLGDGLIERRRHGGIASGEERPGTRWSMVVAWLVGFATYQWIVPTGPTRWVSWVTDHVPGAGQHANLGASLPSFVVAFVLAMVVALVRRPARVPTESDGAPIGSGEASVR